MRTHLVEIGPNAIRRLCCGVGIVADREMEQTALGSIDDTIALVDSRPIAVESLWRSALKSVSCVAAERVVVVHPSWWAPSRVGMVTAAATVLADDVVMKPRPWLLHRASSDTAAIVEITDGFVVMTGEVVVAASRREQDHVVEAVVSGASGTAGTVVIDAPRTVQGACELAAVIAKELRASGCASAIQVDDMALRKLVGSLVSDDAARQVSTRRWQLALVAPIAATVVGVGMMVWHVTPQSRVTMPTTELVEGHVAVEVPANWPVRRITAGPGSARLQISSPSDPEVALHVTQSRVALETLDATAEFLRGAIDAAPTGVFVDFNPAGRHAGRPVVTYREVRASHDVRWTVWVDKAVRISVGCQSRPSQQESVRRECDLAIRSARALI
jgi:type VII secretion-associated protein (TIGR03931 family)